jgi:hypothetical protein
VTVKATSVPLSTFYGVLDAAPGVLRPGYDANGCGVAGYGVAENVVPGYRVIA